MKVAPDHILEQLREEIITNPHDDLLRLVYADRLEELGKVDLAAFTRNPEPIKIETISRGNNVVFKKCDGKPLMTTREKIDYRLAVGLAKRFRHCFSSGCKLAVRMGFIEVVRLHNTTEWIKVGRLLVQKMPIRLVEFSSTFIETGLLSRLFSASAIWLQMLKLATDHERLAYTNTSIQCSSPHAAADLVSRAALAWARSTD